MIIISNNNKTLHYYSSSLFRSRSLRHGKRRPRRRPRETSVSLSSRAKSVCRRTSPRIHTKQFDSGIDLVTRCRKRHLGLARQVLHLEIPEGLRRRCQNVPLHSSSEPRPKHDDFCNQTRCVDKNIV